MSIVSTPHAGRLEGASDRPEFKGIRPKTGSIATHCKSATCRSVTWKDLYVYTCTGTGDWLPNAIAAIRFHLNVETAGAVAVGISALGRRWSEKIIWKLLLTIWNNCEAVTKLPLLMQCGALVKHASNAKLPTKKQRNLLTHCPPATRTLLNKRISVSVILREPMQVKGMNGVWCNLARDTLVVLRNLNLSAIVSTRQIVSWLTGLVETLLLTRRATPRIIRVAVRNPVRVNRKVNDVLRKHCITQVFVEPACTQRCAGEWPVLVMLTGTGSGAAAHERPSVRSFPAGELAQ